MRLAAMERDATPSQPETPIRPHSGRKRSGNNGTVRMRRDPKSEVNAHLLAFPPVPRVVWDILPRWGSRVRIPSSAPGQRRFPGLAASRRVTLWVTVTLTESAHSLLASNRRAPSCPATARSAGRKISDCSGLGSQSRAGSDSWAGLTRGKYPTIVSLDGYDQGHAPVSGLPDSGSFPRLWA